METVMHMAPASLQTAAFQIWKVEKRLSADNIINANPVFNVHTLNIKCGISRRGGGDGTACRATESKEQQNDYCE
jgi:hypothetical protein